jgi:Glycosyl transferase family 11
MYLMTELLIIFFGLFVTFLALYVECVTKPQSSTRVTESKSVEDEEFVTVVLNGGLGNQMFEVAAAYAYGQNHQKKLIMDHSIKNISKRSTYFDTKFKWTRNDVLKKSWKECKEKRFMFDELPLVKGDVKLVGYFQSSKYFDEYRKDIVDLYNTTKVKLPTEIEGVKVSVHFRRGDYVGHAMHTNQQMQYYIYAVKLLQTFDYDLNLVIFSDDIVWCKENLASLWREQTGVKLTYLDEYMENVTDEEEMSLMSQCDHHIIANSSFSWWGAYMDLKPDAKTVAPKQWFNNEIKEWDDIYCAGWLVI